MNFDLQIADYSGFVDLRRFLDKHLAMPYCFEIPLTCCLIEKDSSGNFDRGYLFLFLEREKVFLEFSELRNWKLMLLDPDRYAGQMPVG